MINFILPSARPILPFVNRITKTNRFSFIQRMFTIKKNNTIVNLEKKRLEQHSILEKTRKKMREEIKKINPNDWKEIKIKPEVWEKLKKESENWSNHY